MSGSNHNIAELIDETSWCNDFDWKQIRTLAGYMQVVEAKQDDVVLDEGTGDAHLCLIASGSVAIRKQDSEGEVRELTRIRAGKTFGEMSLLDGQPRSAAVVATEDSLLLLLTEEAFGRLCEDHPPIGILLLKKLGFLVSQRLRQTSGVMVDFLNH